MYEVRCTTGDVRCTMYDVQCVPRLREFRGLYNIMDWHRFDLVSTVCSWPIQLGQHATMYNVRCTMYEVRCTTGDVRCTMYDVQCVPRLGEFRGLCNVMDWYCLSLVSIVCSWPFQHRLIEFKEPCNDVRRTMYDVRSAMYDVRCTMYTVYWDSESSGGCAIT